MKAPRFSMKRLWSAIAALAVLAASPFSKAESLISIGGIYGEVDTFVPSTAVDNPQRQGSMVIEQAGDFLFVGLPNWSTATQTPGRVFIYKRDAVSGDWTFLQSKGPGNDVYSDNFGSSIATTVVDGFRYLAVAAPNRIYGGSNQFQGNVWLYRYNEGTGLWDSWGYLGAPDAGVPFAADIEFLAGGASTSGVYVGPPMLIVTAPSLGRVYGFTFRPSDFSNTPAITQDLTPPGDLGPIEANGDFLFLQDLSGSTRSHVRQYSLRTAAAISPTATDYDLKSGWSTSFPKSDPSMPVSVSMTPSNVDRNLPDSNPLNGEVDNGEFLAAFGVPDDTLDTAEYPAGPKVWVYRCTTTSVWNGFYGSYPYRVRISDILTALYAPSNGVTYTDFGSEVSISPDGNLIAVAAKVSGSSGGLTDPLEVLLYERTGDATWEYAGQLTGSASQRNDTGFGAPVQYGLDGQLYVADWSNMDSDPANVHGRLYEFGADWSGNAAAVANELRGYLYPEFSTGSQDPNTAAFRYVDHLFRQDTVPAEFSPDLAAVEFGPTEEAAVVDVLETLEIALNSNDPPPELQDLLLDVYYDWSRIKSIQAGEQMVAADFLRVDVPLVDPGSLILTDEIAAVSAALAIQRDAVDTWLKVLTDYPPDNGGVPPGFVALQALGANRQLLPPHVLDGGVRVPAVPTSPLLDGYKDLVYFLEAVSDEAEYTARLGYLYALNGDTTTACDLLAEGLQRATMFALMARGPYPATPPNAATGDALAQGEADFEEGRLALVDMKELLGSERNLLGFDRDFLLILGKPGSQHTDILHSFDTMLAALNSTSPFVNPVLRAEMSQDAALVAWNTYQATSDEVDIELLNLESTLGERIVEILGDGTLPPTEDPASEIYNQAINIERAKQRIIRNGTEISNLQTALDIEFSRLAAEVGILNARQNILINYGDRQAAITEELGYLEAAQKSAEAYSDVDSPGEYFSALISGSASAGLEVGKTQLLQERDRLAAKEQADLVANDIVIANNNSLARTQTMYLEMNLLTIDSLDAALLLEQELGRMAALVRESQRLQARKDLSTAALADRFFASPIHRYRARHLNYIANEDFERAQEFLFFFIRAYEYKYNQTFDVEGWDLPTFFKLRNANELGRLVADMVQAGLFSEPSYDDRFSWFSVRDDFFKFVPEGDPDNPVDPVHSLPENLYADPVDGTLVTYHEAFQSQLDTLLKVVDANRNVVPIPPGAHPLDPGYQDVQLIVPFSTTRDRPGDLFFDRQTHADKIIALHVNVPGVHTLGRTSVSGTLILSGTSFMRNPTPGVVVDPAFPNKIVGEMNAFPVREWTVAGGAWAYNDEQRERITISLTPDDRIPPSVLSIDSFNERSVAASNWELRVDIREDGVDLVDPEEIRDLEIYFHHKSISRD